MSTGARWRRAGTPSWLAGLPVSIGIHLVVVVTAVAFLRAEHAPTGLVVDLSAIVADRDDGAARRSDTPVADAPSASVPTPAREEPRSREREVARRVPSPASPAPSTAAAPAPAPSPPAPEVPPHDPPPPASPPIAAPPAVPPEQPPGVSREMPSSAAASTAAPAPPAIAPPAAGSAAARGRGIAGGPADAGAAGGRGSGGEQGTGGGGIGGGAGDRVAAIGPGSGSGPGSDYAEYLSGLRQRIHETLRYPPAARRRGVSGTVQLEIAIQPDGSIGTVTVVASSSHDVLDRAAVDAARSLHRVPFPGDVRPRALTVRLPVIFELQ